MKIKDRKYKVENLYVVKVCEISNFTHSSFLFGPTNIESKLYKHYFIAHFDRKQKKYYVSTSRNLFTVPSLYQKNIPDDFDMDSKIGDIVIREKKHFYTFYSTSKKKLSYQQILKYEERLNENIQNANTPKENDKMPDLYYNDK